MDDRHVFISFPQRFTGVVKNERIKNEYVVSDAVREWFAYKVLVELPRYYRITESASAKATKAQARSESDKVLAFAEAYGNGKDKELGLFPWLFGEEPSLDEFDEVPDVSRGTWHEYPATSLGAPSTYVKKKRKARGFVHRTAWERFEQTGATPQDDAYGQTP